MLDMIAFTYFLDEHGGNEELDGTDIIDGSVKPYGILTIDFTIYVDYLTDNLESRIGPEPGHAE